MEGEEGGEEGGEGKRKIRKRIGESRTYRRAVFGTMYSLSLVTK